MKNFSWLPVHKAEVGAKMLVNVENKLVPTFVVSVKFRFYVGPTYNFEASDLHTYFADGVLVHNSSDCSNSSTWPPNCF
jgi:hypothetical protein